MPVAGRSTIGEIALLLRTELRTFLAWPAERVIVSALDDPPHYLAEQDLVLRIRGERVGKGRDAGGRVVSWRTRRMSVIVRSRMNLDPGGQHAKHLLDATLGHHTLEDRVVDCLEMFLPADGDGVPYLAEPVRCNDWSEPKPEAKDSKWVDSVLDVELTYLRNLDLTRGV